MAWKLEVGDHSDIILRVSAKKPRCQLLFERVRRATVSKGNQKKKIPTGKTQKAVQSCHSMADLAILRYKCI